MTEAILQNHSFLFGWQRSFLYAIISVRVSSTFSSLICGAVFDRSQETERERDDTVFLSSFPFLLIFILLMGQDFFDKQCVRI